MHLILKNNKLRIYLVSIVFLGLFVFSTSCFADPHDHSGGSQGGAANPINSCGSKPETECYSSHNANGDDHSGGGGDWGQISIKDDLLPY